MLLTASRSVLLIIDLQERLVPAIHDGDAVVARTALLGEASGLLDVPVAATEQYPQGLGPTVPELGAFPQLVMPKTAFSAVDEPGFDTLLPPGRDEVVVTGAEAHVCVLQTVVGLRDRDLRVVLVADAVGSRRPSDRDAALQRAREHGAEVVTSEMVLFEWMRDSRHPRFREISKRLR
ncbi:hydrolase [Pseudonocardia sp. N23]|uniref:hydrolase n=1 Tax=Pseudonocardia sp. N23 TaxID=1987376 RepID=UPI000BFC6243|nr:hydrolase [Pseudonocardia sp. N23]GAY10359.1 isochorismatase [Pseudonocardia sp. N23]